MAFIQYRKNTKRVLLQHGSSTQLDCYRHSQMSDSNRCGNGAFGGTNSCPGICLNNGGSVVRSCQFEWTHHDMTLRSSIGEQVYFKCDQRVMFSAMKAHSVYLHSCTSFQAHMKMVCAHWLIASKTRVAPLKKVALLRLELLVALIGARLGNYIGTHLKMEKTQMHTTKQWKPFAENGAKEIQSLTEPLKWRHCCGKENPADAGTRGPINWKCAQGHSG